MKGLLVIGLAFFSISASEAAAEPLVWAVNVGPGTNDVRGLPLRSSEADAMFGTLSSDAASEIARASDAVFSYLSAPGRDWRGARLNTATSECVHSSEANYCRRKFDAIDVPTLRTLLSGATVYDPYSLGSNGERQFAVQMIRGRSAGGTEMPEMAMVFVLVNGRVTSIVFNIQPWIQLSPPPSTTQGSSHG